MQFIIGIGVQWAEMPSPRKHSREEMDSWVARDEADMEAFRRGA
jgi:hypothetical protein